MPRKRKAYVHVGLDAAASDVVARAVHAHGNSLLELGVKVPAKSREEMLRATADLLDDATAWGYSPDDVAGTWDQLCRRAAKGRDTIVVSEPLLAAADDAAVARVTDGLSGLPGLEVHVVVVAQAPDVCTASDNPAHDLAAVVGRWLHAVRHPERLHVIVETEPAQAWRSFGRTVGFGTASLRVDTLATSAPRPVPVGSLHSDVLEKLGTDWAEFLLASDVDLVGDPEDLVPDVETHPAFDVVATERALAASRHEAERLTRHNEALTLRLASLERKRAKLKRRLSEAE